MGFRFRKTFRLGNGFNLNFSKSGVGYSWGNKLFRFGKTAKGKIRKTVTIPNTGVSYITETEPANDGKIKDKSFDDIINEVSNNLESRLENEEENKDSSNSN
ncbi:MAG: DUF4236 domain-containing protein [Bacilli bacterium]|jgi:hypothetical protein|nr:DUF4236 domain-containing protein [Bacilli bacterium]